MSLHFTSFIGTRGSRKLSESIDDKRCLVQKAMIEITEYPAVHQSNFAKRYELGCRLNT